MDFAVARVLALFVIIILAIAFYVNNQHLFKTKYIYLNKNQRSVVAVLIGFLIGGPVGGNSGVMLGLLFAYLIYQSLQKNNRVGIIVLRR